MKTKTMKILVCIATVLFIVSFLSGIVLAAADAGNIIDGMESSADTSSADTSSLTSIGGQVLNVLQIAGIVIGVIILVILGVKYMTGSLEEKAEYKKTMIPYLVGAVIIFAGPMIAKAIFTMIASFGSGSGSGAGT